MKFKKSFIEETHQNTELEERLGRVLREFSNEQESISVAEIESWVEKDKMKKREKRRRITSIAACFVLIFGLGLTMRYYVNMDDPIAVAGKDDDKVATEVDGKVVVKNDGDGAEDHVGGGNEVHATWEAVLTASKEYPDMLIPGHIPDGYEFKELIISNGDIRKTCDFIFTSSTDELVISEELKADVSTVGNYDMKKKTEQGNIVYFIDDNGEFFSFTNISKTAITVRSKRGDHHMSILNSIEIKK